MTRKTKAVYHLAMRDDKFDSEMVAADRKDTKPGFWDGDMVRTVYASMYYAWYLGKYGVEKTKEVFEHL